MKYILENPKEFYHSEPIDLIIEELSREYSQYEHSFVVKEDLIGLVTFKNSKINRTLAMMLNVASQSTSYIANEIDGTIYGPDTTRYFDEIKANPISTEQIYNFLKNKENYLESLLIPYKYMVLIPLDLRIKYIINNRLDLIGTYEYLGVDVRDDFS